MAAYNHGVLAVIVATFTIALLLIILRIVARRITGVRIWWDDYLAIVAFLFSTAWCAVVMHCESSHLLRYPVKLTGLRDSGWWTRPQAQRYRHSP